MREQVLKTGVVESVLAFAAFKQSKELKKTDGAKRGRLVGIPKLDDANEAGGRNSDKCTLILTEGDSAKALAISGLSVVGRDHYGVFPLRGKLLNVRDATHQQARARRLRLLLLLRLHLLRADARRASRARADHGQRGD